MSFLKCNISQKLCWHWHNCRKGNLPIKSFLQTSMKYEVACSFFNKSESFISYATFLSIYTSHTTDHTADRQAEKYMIIEWFIFLKKSKQGIIHYMYFTLGSHHRSANVLNMCWQDLLLVYISSFHFYCHYNSKSCKFNIFPSHYNTVIFLLSSFPKKKYVFMMDIFKRSNCIPFSRTNRNGVSGHGQFSLKNTWSCSL